MVVNVRLHNWTSCDVASATRSPVPRLWPNNTGLWLGYMFKQLERPPSSVRQAGICLGEFSAVTDENVVCLIAHCLKVAMEQQLILRDQLTELAGVSEPCMLELMMDLQVTLC